ncbi:LysR family transcriptional regulator substrate-binding protein [Streptomyces sp. 150FB]|uniref:LysR family transcriptional regulator substrate-binding protein n=1 Tax=Streptomyces sp. 150FB TaxID=1576605 RepID=UPI000698B5D1|nr:LysR family transcriptional regulator substrate-binding protein [Streptomyces sp. 150FB]
MTDLDDDPLILSPNGCERDVRKIYQAARARFSPSHRIRDLGTLISMVQMRGRAIPARTDMPMPARADLVLVPVEPHHSRRLMLCGPDDRPWSPAVRALVDSVGPPAPGRTRRDRDMTSGTRAPQAPGASPATSGCSAGTRRIRAG